MAFRINSPIDSNQHKGLLGVNSINGNPLAITGLSLTNAQPIHVAIVDASGSQVIPAGTGTTGDVNIKQVNGATVNVGTGTAGTGTQRVAVSSDSTINAVQSGTWNINNVSGTISLPTGAATAAKQPALGTAGTASADVITVQGIASMTALKVDGSGVTQPVSGTVSVTGVATAANQTNGSQLVQLSDGTHQVTVTNNKLDVNATVSGGSGTSSNFTSAFPSAGTAAGYNDGTNMQGARVYDLDSGAGTEYGQGVNLRAIANGGSVETGVSGHPLVSEISNGTNIVDIIANDTGYNGMANNATMKVLGPFSSTGTGAQILADNTDVRGYASVRVIWTSIGSGLAGNLQFAPNSGGTYSSSLANINRGSATAIPGSLGVAVSTWYEGPTIGPYMHINITALTSGTATAYIILSTFPPSAQGVATVGTKTNNNAAPTNLVASLPGIANAAQQSWTEGFAVMASMNLKGSQRMVIQDAALNDRGVNVTASNAMLVDISATGANATAIKVDGSAVTQPVSGTVTANAGTNLNTSALALETGGNLATIAGAIIAQEATTSGVKGITAFGAVTTNAPSYTTAKSDALSLDTSGLLRVSIKDTPSNTNNINVAVAAGTNAIGTVQPGNTQNTTPWLTAPSANTGAVGTSFNYQSALSSTKTAIKASAGNLYGSHIYNPNVAAVYIQCFNKTTANVTVGVTAPDFVFVVPATGWVDEGYTVPIAFGTALTVAATTTASGSTAPTTALTANFWYI